QFHADGLVVDTNQPAAQAILHMGSAAVPILVRELRTRDSVTKLKLMELLQKQSVIRFGFTPAYIRQRRAIEACFALGPTAKAAMTWAHIHKRPDLVLPALTQNLADTNDSVRSLTATALAQFRHTLPQTP